MERKTEILRRFFGYTAFRHGQEEIVDALCAGRDVLCVMPTGAGKSICYQVPALLMPGITLVVSPLISLMKDQVEALNQNGVPAAFLNSSLSAQEYGQTLYDIEDGRYKLLYVAPERLSAEGFRALCERLNISMIAVDEAHCVSQWGQDFRPEYLKIAAFVETLPKRPVIGAFTATATKTVRQDIADLLGLRSPVRITTGFDRPNLYLGVEMPNSKPLALLRLIGERKGKCGIVYCATRRAVEETDELLREKGILSTRYHAGLSEGERRKNQEDFIYDRKHVMVATNAFGMGIDKSNVSFVIHYNMPKNIESYYQEAGRAGRDGGPAECILLFGRKDVQINRYLIENSEPNPDLDPDTQDAIIQRDLERLRRMEHYCLTQDCLRAYILKYFGEETQENCANCSSCAAGSALIDATVQAQQVLSCTVRCGQRFGSGMIVDVLRGVQNERVMQLGFDRLSTFGLMKEKTVWEVRRAIDALLVQGYLQQTDGDRPVLQITAAARELLLGKKSFEMRVPVAPVTVTADKSDLMPDEALFAKLKKLRQKLAIRASVPAYVVFTDATLRQMSAEKPQDLQQLLQISGVGEKKAEKYGKAFLKEIAAHINDDQSGN